MIKVLQIRETPRSKFAGVDANCQALIELFEGDDQIRLLPTINYKRYRIPFINQYFLSPRQLLKSIKEQNPDIIHIHGATTFTLPISIWLAKMMKKPVAVSTHFHPFHTLKRPLLGKIYFNYVLRLCLKYVNTVFTINNEDTFIINKIARHVVKIPHWSKFNKPETTIPKVKNQILFVGRLVGINKGFDHLFHLPEGKYIIKCVGIGDREFRSDMEHMTDISNKEMKKLFRESSLLVVPSRYEAFSYVTLEALYSNTPVVLSERVRIADYLESVKGVSIFNYGDYEGFEKAVSETIGNPVDISTVDLTFSPTRIKQIYKDEYIKLANLI